MGTDLSFFEKLERQLRPARPDTKKLAAEMLWLLYLFPLDTKGDTKREHIKRVWEWSGEPLDSSNPWLGDALDTGIGAANPGLSNYKPNELALIVAGTCGWLNLSPEERATRTDSWMFANWLDGVPEAKGRQFRHIWVYLMYPDEFEPISSETHKRLIIKQYRDKAGVADALRAIETPTDSDRVRDDKILLSIRQCIEPRDLDVVALDLALTDLATFDPKKVRMVELRYFAGLSIPETAEALGVSPMTIKREWAIARAWLYDRLTGAAPKG
jgi:DNA-directed RNA polymerase specialized sigma24 family protein